MHNACLACVSACVILASISVLPRYLHTCMMELVYPLEDSIVIDDIESSSLDEFLSASSPPPMSALLLYILTLEGNTFTSGKGWPKLSVLSLAFSFSMLPSICYHEVTSLTHRQTNYPWKKIQRNSLL